MADGDDDVRAQLIKVGLEDPFIRAIAGIVVVAIAASFVISLLGNGMSAVLAIGMSIVFGVILVLMRVLIRNTDGVFVKWLCFTIAGAITVVFVMLIVFVVPAVIICWPEAYRDTLGLKACPMQGSTGGSGTGSVPVSNTVFTPVPFAGQGITIDPANGKSTLLVFYRASRQADAERIVGAFLSAGFQSSGQLSTLNEVQTDDRSPDVTLIKTSPAAQSLLAEALRITKLAIPLKGGQIRINPAPTNLARGDVQVDLF